MKLKYADQMVNANNPLHWDAERDQLFVNACKEMANFHYQNNPVIKHIYDKKEFEPQSLKTISDIKRIPSIGVQAMKYHLLTSMEHTNCELKLTSSGTKGQKTQIWFDHDSLQRLQKMLYTLWNGEGLVSEKPTNYMIFIYDPKDAKDLGITFSIQNQQRFAPPAETYFTIQMKNNEWKFMKEETIQKLIEFSVQGRPVRLSGIPSFIFELITEMKENIQLPEGSFIFTGGGWKSAENKKVGKDIFRQKASQMLGIPEENIRDGYGMAEHSSPYIECAHHRFHIPFYNRIISRNPETMEPIPPGKIGLLELISPYNTMMPNLSVLSTDLGYIDPEPCTCGISSPTFSLTGRGGLAKHKGCAITANEILKR